MGRVLNRSRKRGQERKAVAGGGTVNNLVWFSDWRNGTGTTITQVGDGGKWPTLNGDLANNQLAAVSAAGKGFPTTNVLDIIWDGDSNHSTQIQTTSAVITSVPATGQYGYLRFFWRQEVADGQDLGQVHPVQADNNASYWHIHPQTATSGAMPFNLRLEQNAFPDHYFNATLSTYHTYMVQISIFRVSSTVGKFRIKVSDIDGLNEIDSSSFLNDAGPAVSLATRNPDTPIADGAYTLLDVGNNDPNTTGVGHSFTGGWAFAISDSANAWIGTYPTVVEA